MSTTPESFEPTPEAQALLDRLRHAEATTRAVLDALDSPEAAAFVRDLATPNQAKPTPALVRDWANDAYKAGKISDRACVAVLDMALGFSMARTSHMQMAELCAYGAEGRLAEVLRVQPEIIAEVGSALLDV